jgi:hypothetical protein
MTRDELEHAIRAACDIAQDNAVYVFGSQSILGQYPAAPAALRQSVEVDVAPVNRADRADAIDGSIGELSMFHETFGFYVHGLSIEAATLPMDWKERLIEVRGPTTYGNAGLCLEGHDLAASKLAAFRDKDREFVRVLLAERLVTAVILYERLATLELDQLERDRRIEWVKLTATALGISR